MAAKAKTVKVEDAHGNKIEVPAGLDGKNPVNPNNPSPKSVGAVSDDVYSAGGQPFEGSFGDGQDLLKASQGDPGHPDKDNTDDSDKDEKNDDSDKDESKKSSAKKTTSS